MFASRNMRLLGGGLVLSSSTACIAAPLIVWAGVFIYLMVLDSKVRKLKK